MVTDGTSHDRNDYRLASHSDWHLVPRKLGRLESGPPTHNIPSSGQGRGRNVSRIEVISQVQFHGVVYCDKYDILQVSTFTTAFRAMIRVFTRRKLPAGGENNGPSEPLTHRWRPVSRPPNGAVHQSVRKYGSIRILSWHEECIGSGPPT